MSSQREIGLGVIGGGLMGREIASAVARWDHLLDFPVRPVLRSVASVPESTLEYFAKSRPRPDHLTTDYHQLLANPAVEAVYVAVPHNLHRQVYTDVLRAGKHLLGEKPFGIDREAFQAIAAEAAARPELVVRCSSEFPFYPAAQRIVRMVRSGQMGRILGVECGLLHSSDMDPDKPINWKRQSAINGLYGCLGDLGMHAMHVPLRLGWTMKNVRAVLTKAVADRPKSAGSSERVPCDTWDNGTLFVEAADAAGNSFPLTAKLYRMAPGESNTWVLSVLGTKSSAVYSSRNPQILRVMTYTPGQPQAWQEIVVGNDPVYKTITGAIFEVGFSDTILQMIAAFIDQVAQGPQAELPFGCATLEEAGATHELFTAALRSQETAGTVPIR